MQLRHVTGSLVALAAVAGPIAGCGSSGSSATAAGSGGSARPAASSGPSVTISGFKFAPPSLTVSPGAKVTVANQDGTAHTATAEGTFDTGDIGPGTSATITVAKAGTYHYHCSIHPFMHGTLVVK
jgi:plastocyanin